MSNMVVLPKNVNIDNIKIGKVKKLGSSLANISHISLNDENFALQLPEMNSPFGKSSWTNDNGTTKHWVDLSFRDIEKRIPLQVFQNLIKNIDEKIVKHAYENCNEFFKKKYNNIDVVRALFTQSIRYPKDKITGEITDKWPPTFKITLPQKNGEFNFEAYNRKKELIDINDIETKGSMICSIIQCGGIWIAGGKFGVTWRVIQLEITPKSKITGYSFINNPEDRIANVDDDDENDDNVNVVKKSIQKNMFIDDNDNDSDDSDYEEA